MLTISSTITRLLSPAFVLIICTASVSQAQTFSNPAQIRIPATGTGPGIASPYPSNIVVSGISAPVGDVTVTVTGLTHTFPADIGILLVGPTGQSVVLMASCGGTCDLNNINLKFSDGAAQLSSDCVVSGTCSPTSLAPPAFDPPAPGGPYGNALSLFSGTSANGTWSLYVIDDAFLDSGSITGGWSITFSNPSLTYQGRLDNGNQAVNSNSDFIFSLYDAPTGGTALRTVARNNVAVVNGLFNVDLGVDASLFDGTPRWIEIFARTPSGLGFFTLIGRQPLNYTPQSIYARSAGFARTATSAANATHAEQAATASVANFASQADAADFASSAGTADFATAATRLDAPDGSPTGVIVVSNSGEVGIPIATIGNKFTVIGDTHLAGNLALGLNLLSAQTLLQVSGGTSGATVQPDAQLMVENFDASYINIASRDGNERGISFGSPVSSVHGGIYYKNAVGMDFRTNNNLSRMTINSAGNVGIGVGVSGGSIDARLHVAGGAASVRPLKVDRTGSDGELIAFARDDGIVGNITLAGGIVSYNAFTGSHWAWMQNGTAPVSRGTLVSMTGDNHSSPGGSEVIYGVTVSARANDPACLGAYLAPADGIAQGHQIMAAGNGEMWVLHTDRDIQPGDYLISSDEAGYAMLDDPQRFATGHVIARAAQAVHWKDISGPKVRISVLFGSFLRGASKDSRVRDLEIQNAQLLERVERLERALTTGQ